MLLIDRHRSLRTSLAVRLLYGPMYLLFRKMDWLRVSPRRSLGLLCLLSLLAQPLPAAGASTFSDIGGSWYRAAIESLAEEKVLTGYADGTFKPAQEVNRAEFITVLMRGRGGTPAVSRRCFADVQVYQWYTPAVCAAKRRGIVNGYRGNVFKPTQTVTLAEALKMLLEAYDHQPPEREPGETWYDPYLKEARERSIYVGGEADLGRPLTRERMADLLHRTLHPGQTVVQSSGCNEAPPSAVPSTVQSSDLTRQFLLTVPANYRSDVPHRLIVAFHGRTNSNAQVRAYYGLDQAASDAIIAYPAALSGGNGSFTYADPTGDMRDVQFFDDLVDLLSRTYCVDRDRIFVAGHSLGAWFANTLSCVRGDRIRGVGSLGGSASNPPCSGPVAALIMHSPEDNLAPFSGGERARDLKLAQNGCTGSPSPTEPASFNCVRYDQCTSGRPVIWCPHPFTTENGKRYTHLWPRGTGEEIVKFFEAIERL